MADSKQYITQLQEKGSVQISEDVIVAIVAHAAQEVEGVVSLNVKPVSDIADLCHLHELCAYRNFGRLVYSVG